MCGCTSCGTTSVAKAVAGSCRPASMISNAAPVGRPDGETFFHVAPSSVVTWTIPLLVADQIRPAFNDDNENVVIAGICGDRVEVAGLAAASVRSGLISCHVMPPLDVFIM